jgi:hypothetical protein
LSKNSRRDFLKGLGAGAVGATLVVTAPGQATVKVKEHVKHTFVEHEHFLTYGDGTQEGDRAMLKVDGQYRSHVLRGKKWRLMFMD